MSVCVCVDVTDWEMMMMGCLCRCTVVLSIYQTGCRTAAMPALIVIFLTSGPVRCEATPVKVAA